MLRWIRRMLLRLLRVPRAPRAELLEPWAGPPAPADGGWEIDDEGYLQGDGVEHQLAHLSWSKPMADAYPDLVVWHYTATKPGTGPVMHRRRSEAYRPGVDRAASWHFTVEADGRVIQMTSTVRSAWHAGRTRWGPRGAQIPVNPHSIGIELVSVDGSDFPQVQVEAAEKLLCAIVAEYPRMERRHVEIGHSQLDPKRRSDPGDLWMKDLLPQMLDRIYRK